ncbi:hypothetical protein D3C75_158910 [compost metagenome]
MSSVIDFGTWVSAEDVKGNAYIGYVKSKTAQGYVIVIPSLNTERFFPKEVVVKCPLYLTEEEIDDVIDLALLLKDKKWFEELLKEKDSCRWSHN